MTDVLPPTIAPLALQPALTQRLEGEQLEEAILKQIEYYFSRQNLANDAYLVSQMDSDMWVPITTIAGFKKVHILTKDIDLIVKVMSKSPNVVVDTTRMAMKPSWKLQRNTIILRDIPSDAPEEEVRQLFASKPVTNIHSDIGDTWFVTFATEEDAIDALTHVQHALFRETPVKARMKSEHLLKSSAAQMYTQPYAVDPAAYQYRGYPQYSPRGPYNGQQQPYWDGQTTNGVDAGKVGGDGRRQYRGGRRGPTSPHGAGGLPTGGVVATAPPTGRPRGNSRGQGQAPFKGDADAAKRGGARGKGKKGVITEVQKPVVSNGIHPLPSVIVPQLNQQHFPSLLSPSSRPNKANFKSGYTADFRKFTKEDILRIINTVQDVSTRPSTVIVAEPGVVEQKPNTELEVKDAPPTPDPSTTPEPLELAVAPVNVAPGVAVREWPLEKRTIPALSSQVFVPKKATIDAALANSSPQQPQAVPAPAAVAAVAPVAVAPTPTPTTASTSPQQGELRKSSEQGEKEAVPRSPSLVGSSDAIRGPTYADIALRISRTTSPPINGGMAKSPSLPSSNPPSSPSLSAANLSAAPPTPPMTALDGKTQ